MNALAIFLIVLGSLTVGAAITFAQLANRHRQLADELEQLAGTRWALQRERDELVRMQGLLRESLHLEAREPRVVLDLGAHKRKAGLVS